MVFPFSLSFFFILLLPRFWLKTFFLSSTGSMPGDPHPPVVKVYFNTYNYKYPWVPQFQRASDSLLTVLTCHRGKLVQKGGALVRSARNLLNFTKVNRYSYCRILRNVVGLLPRRDFIQYILFGIWIIKFALAVASLEFVSTLVQFVITAITLHIFCHSKTNSFYYLNLQWHGLWKQHILK